MANDIPFLPGERLLRKAFARAKQGPFSGWVGADGWLHLTNQRLYWKRRWLNIPGWGLSTFELPLTHTVDCRVQGNGIALEVATERKMFRFELADNPFVPYGFHKTYTREWLAELEAAIAPAKLTDGASD